MPRVYLAVARGNDGNGASVPYTSQPPLNLGEECFVFCV